MLGRGEGRSWTDEVAFSRVREESHVRRNSFEGERALWEGDDNRATTKLTRRSVQISYGYSKSIISPPDDWNVDEIKKSFKAPNASLQMKTVCGFRGDFLTSNAHHFADSEKKGWVVYAVAALVVVQRLVTEGEEATTEQMHFREHDDDVTCVAVEIGGAVRRAAR